MKIIQSYWSKPSQYQDVAEGRANGGWLGPEYHYMSMALSCLLLRRHYPEVELITDTPGKKLLIDYLGLPFTRVSVELDALQEYPPSLWAAAKLYAYSLQEQPFIHVDGDVFTWSPFDRGAESDGLIVQSPELNHEAIYRAPLQRLASQYAQLPHSLLEAASAPNLVSINAGVIGGSDVLFLRQFAREALNFTLDNLPALAADDQAGTYNIVLEQLLFWRLAQQQRREVRFIVPELSLDFTEVTHFELVPFAAKYIHLISASKKQFYLCEQVEARLRFEFPEEYHRLRRCLRNLMPLPARAPVATNQEPILALLPGMLLSQKIFEGRSQRELMELTVEQLQKTAARTVDLEWAQQVQQLELAVHRCQAAPPFTFDARQQLYRFLADCTVAQLTSLPLTLSASARVIESLYPLEALVEARAGLLAHPTASGETHYIILQNRGDNIYAQNLTGWSQLLVYFADTELSGTDLIQDVFGPDGVGMPADAAADIVVALECAHLVYSGYLQVK